MSSIASDLILVVIAGLIGGLIARLIRQPLVMGYISAGIIVGPNVGILEVSNPQNIVQLAEIGAALLLFSLGLEFSAKDLKSIWKIALFGTGIQVILTFIGCALLATYFGWELLAALWLAGAVVSSSTALIMRTLDAKGVRKTLSGRIMLGISIMQDLLVIPILIILLQLNSKGSALAEIFISIIVSAAFLAFMGFTAVKFMPAILHKVAKLESQELFILSTASIGLAVAYLSYLVGLSVAFGAFIAGLVLSESDFGAKAFSEMLPLRGLFGLVFFASIGMLFEPVFVIANYKIIIALLLAITFGKGIILTFITFAFGYRRIVPLAILFGMIPISEIAFILAREAIAVNVISPYVYSCILNIVILSMLSGPFIASLSAPAYSLFRIFKPSKDINDSNSSVQTLSDHVILIGNDEYFDQIAKSLSQKKTKLVVISSIYQSFYQLSNSGFKRIYADAEKEGVLESANIASAKVVIIADSDSTSTETIIQKAQAANSDIHIICITHTEEVYKKLSCYSNVKAILPEKQIAKETLEILYRFSIVKKPLNCILK